MDTLTQIISALYVALGEAAGGPQAMRVANRVLREAIADHSIDDPTAIQILSALAVDEDVLALQPPEIWAVFETLETLH